MRLFVGDDWAEDHHDVEVMDGSGRRLARARLPEGVAGVARVHAMIGDPLGGGGGEDGGGVGGGETDRGPGGGGLGAARHPGRGGHPL